MASKANSRTPDISTVPAEDRFDISKESPEVQQGFSESAIRHTRKLRAQARTERLSPADRKRIADLRDLKT